MPREINNLSNDSRRTLCANPCCNDKQYILNTCKGSTGSICCKSLAFCEKDVILIYKPHNSEIEILNIMKVSGKKILVIVIMAVLVSSVIAGAASLFNRSATTTTTNNNQTLLNARINNVVNFCINSLPNGTSACDNQLGPVVNRICSEDINARQALDSCHDGKITQYYKTRNDEITKRSVVVGNNNSGK